MVIKKKPKTEYDELKKSLPKKLVTVGGKTKSRTLFETEDQKFLGRLIFTMTSYSSILASLVLVSRKSKTKGRVSTFLFLCVLAGIFKKQIALCAHEVGHLSAIRGSRSNRFLSLFLGPVKLGVSNSWWVKKHNDHHFAPNRFGVDTDIEFPIIAFDIRQAKEKRRIFQPILRNQHILFVPLLMFQALNTQLGTIFYLRQKPKDYQLQAAGVALHWLFIAFLIRRMGSVYGLIFLIVMSAVQGLCNGSVFAPNHKGMPLIEKDAPSDRLKDQVETSRNVEAKSRIGKKFLDFWCDGLQHQIEHHLFPTMPMDNLEKVAPLVRAFCESRGISYSSVSILESFKLVYGMLRDVAYESRALHEQEKLVTKEIKYLGKEAY